MENTKKSFINKLSDFLTPIAARMQQFKMITALTQTMQATMPIIIVGSFACLVVNVDILGWQKFVANHLYIRMICMAIQSLTINIFGLYVLLILPYLYATSLKIKQSVAIIPLTVAAYLLLTPHELYTSIGMEWLGSMGLVSIILTSFLVVRVTKLLLDNRICIRMPSGVPKFVEDAFAILVPAIIIFVLFASIQYFISRTEFGSIHNIIYLLLQQPLQVLGLSLFGQTIVETFATLSMYLGLHYSTIAGVFEPLRVAASAVNLEAWYAGNEIPNIICGTFNSLAQIGAGGSCLIVTLSFLLFAKSKRYKNISMLALIPGIFGVGEPILYGLPIMLNPTCFIPFMLVTIFNQIYAYVVIALGFVGKFTGVTVPWTCPPFLNVILANSTPVRACIALAILIIIDLAIWYPFVKIMDRQAVKEESAVIETKE